MNEKTPLVEAPGVFGDEASAKQLGRITILEALAEETNLIAMDAMARSTPAGNNVDFDD